MLMNLSYEDTVMLWDDVVEMAHDCNDVSILPWLERLAPVSLKNNVMTVSTRQNWTVKKIVGEYQATIEALLHEITLEPIALQVIVAGTANVGATSPETTGSLPVIGGAAGTGQMPAIQAATSAPPAAHASMHGSMFHVKHSEVPAYIPQVEEAQRDIPDTQGERQTGPSPAAMIGAAVAAGRNPFFTANKPPYESNREEAGSSTGMESRFAAVVPDQTGGQQTPIPSMAPNAPTMAAHMPSAVGTTSSIGTPQSVGTPQGVIAPQNVIAPQDANTVQSASTSQNMGMAQGMGVTSAMGAPTTFGAISAVDTQVASAVPTISAPPIVPAPTSEPDETHAYEILAEPEIVPQEAVVPILEDGAVPKAAVSSGYSDFNFDTYIVGEANKLAYSMAQAVAEQPGGMTNLNPLFIWGPSGNGKTHLLFSILNYLHENQPAMNVQYVAANAFVDQYVDDIRNKRLRGKEVLKAYRAVDVLLVDDVQFFEDKQESVSTFFDIFNELILAGKQIVLVADTPPDYLKLDDRMRTRFSGGLVVDIKSPTYEMKQSILRSYYERCRQRMGWCRVEIPPKLFDTLTQLAPDNPRNMQGLMTSILLKANDDPSVLSPEGIKSAVSDLFKTTEIVSVPSIIRVVTDAYNVTAEEIRGKKRTKNISEARQVVMWMARQLTDESYENIGAELGGRDHSTVYYGISNIEKRSLDDKSYLYKLERLKKEIIG